MKYNHNQGGDYMAENKKKKNKEVNGMGISMAIMPVLKDEAAKSLLETLKTAKLKPYTDEQRKATDEAIERILKEKGKIH